MKRFFSIMMALVMVLSLGITAFADETTETGSITVTNATLGQTYSVYKIFDATYIDETDTVAYTIEKNNQFFPSLFDEVDGKIVPTEANKYFVINSNTMGVSKAEGVNDAELIKFLNDLVINGNFTPAADPIVAELDPETEEVAEVKFTDLDYGYYVVKSTLGTTVTIDSVTPDIEVIDKNQIPGTDLDKQVQTGVDENGNPIYGDSNSAAIGDLFGYKISFTATNYDEDKLIKYYQINDQKGDAIWAEFNSFKVVIKDNAGNVIKELTKGYYLCLGDEAALNTNNWKFLGSGWTGDANVDNRNDAEWYLVHMGVDQFRITIPWLSDHEIVEKPGENGNKSYELKFPAEAESIYPSPVKVEITYNATIEYGAEIGSGRNTYNEAYTSWTSEHESGSSSTDRTETYVYGLGVLKDDLATKVNLAGAEFRLYSDKACTSSVYIIPTNIEGVYIVDDYNNGVSGTNMQTAREMYAAYLDAYLNGKVQDNYAVTPVNGKIVIIGLKEGTYYLLETKAPDGYNALSEPVEFIVNAGTAKNFPIFVDGDGKVADIQAPSGSFVEKDYSVTNTVVHNSKGVELPSTGGAGTMMLITVGTIVAMAFAVLLITHKKMTIYQD